MTTRAPLSAIALVTPVQLMIGGIIFLPAIYVFWLSLNQSSFGQAATFVGLANYAKVLGDPYFWKALLNTVIVVAIVVHVELLIGLGMALFFASGVPMRALLLAIVLAPYAVSEVSAVVMWRYLFEPDVGMMSRLLATIGLPPIEWAVNPSHGLAMVSLLSIWLHLPFSFIILYAARLSIPGDLYEAASIDGASAWTSFRRVTLPLLMPALLIAALFRYIFAFRLFSEVWLMTGGGPARSTEVMAVYLYLEAFRYNAFGSAAATGWLLVLASLLLALFYLRRLYREMFARA
ncbi:MAG: carbohydrate ABC transporter permease [Bosea sp. (in: a-proteobacteria)]|uniref:carbohydrate ABC transporter permease n=1 Tax=Bosea sp. (in: a-proteobacteria) TaxID=1871050 RepID=UPI003F7BC641